MSGLRLNLGWGQVLEADRAALAAILGVCRALDIPVHCNEADGALYIAAPVHGRRLALACGTDRPEIAGRVLDGLRERLSAAGAAVAVIDAPSAQVEQELMLRVDLAAPQTKGVTAVFNWIGWRLNRRLASLLTEELSQALNVPDYGGRPSLTRWRQSGVPVIEVYLPGLDHEPGLVPRAVDALCRGLTRFWANPLLGEAFMSMVEPTEAHESEAQPMIEEPAPEPLPEPMFEFVPTPVPEPEPEPVRAPAAPVNDMREEPRLLLGPETIVEWRQEPLPKRIRRPRLRRKPHKIPVEVAEDSPTATVTVAAEPAPEAPAPTEPELEPAPAEPEPEPAPTVLPIPQRQAVSTFHVFQWSKPLIARPVATTSTPAKGLRPAVFQHGVPLLHSSNGAPMQNHPR